MKKRKKREKPRNDTGKSNGSYVERKHCVLTPSRNVEKAVVRPQVVYTDEETQSMTPSVRGDSRSEDEEDDEEDGEAYEEDYHAYGRARGPRSLLRDSDFEDRQEYSESQEESEDPHERILALEAELRRERSKGAGSSAQAMASRPAPMPHANLQKGKGRAMREEDEDVVFQMALSLSAREAKLQEQVRLAEAKLAADKAKLDEGPGEARGDAARASDFHRDPKKVEKSEVARVFKDVKTVSLRDTWDFKRFNKRLNTSKKGMDVAAKEELQKTLHALTQVVAAIRAEATFRPGESDGSEVIAVSRKRVLQVETLLAEMLRVMATDSFRNAFLLSRARQWDTVTLAAEGKELAPHDAGLINESDLKAARDAQEALTAAPLAVTARGDVRG